MARAAETSPVEGLGQLLGGSAAAPVNSQFVCPFCGSVNDLAEGPCPRCTMDNTPAGRKATKARIGPWYVLQRRNPAAPGMRFETLMSFVRKGRVKPRSVVRGPTTHQLWRFASQVKGLSREFGLCYSCGGPISAQASVCPQCNRLQDPPADPDAFLDLPLDGVAPKIPAAAFSPVPIYVEISAPPEEDSNDANKPAESPQPQEVDSDEADGDQTIADSQEFEADLVIPAMDPDAPPPQQEDENEQEIVIPVLGLNAPPPGGEIIALRGKLNPATRRMSEGERALDRFVPSDVAEQLPRRAMGGSHNRLPPPPREPDPDDMGDDEPFPMVRPVPPPHPALGGRRAGAEVALFALIILGAILSGLLYVDPQLRQQTTGWIFHLKWFRGSDSTADTATADTSGRTNLSPMAATRSNPSYDSTARSKVSDSLPPSRDLTAPSVSPAPSPDSSAAPSRLRRRTNPRRRRGLTRWSTTMPARCGALPSTPKLRIITSRRSTFTSRSKNCRVKPGLRLSNCI